MIVSDTLTLDGQITANGRSGSENAGGGSGGSIWITTGILAGDYRLTSCAITLTTLPSLYLTRSNIS